MSPGISPKVSLNRKFLTNQADVTLDLEAPDAAALATVFRNKKGVIPPGQLVLGDVKAKAGGKGTVSFGQSKGKVTFSGDAEAAFGVGVYLDAADAIKAIAPSAELSSGLTLADPTATRYMIVRAAYDIEASAKGSVALGAGVTGTFGVTGSSSGLFAVMHRFKDEQPALQVFADTFSSWALPKQVDSADDLKPGTWLIAEVDGSLAVQLGVQGGYDFSWVREIPGGGLKGDIGLRVQLGASAAFGFEASGRYAVVLGREAADQVLRLRLYKMAKKGWNFALDARAGVKAILPPFFNQSHKAEDLVAAIFGLNENQIIETFRETRAFVNSNVSLEDKLAGVLMQLGGKAIEETTGLSQDEIRKIYEKGRKRVLELLDKLDNLLKNGGHDLTSMLLSLSGVDLQPLQKALKDIVSTGGEEQVQEVVRRLLSKAGFERTPIARLIEAGVGPALGVINNTDLAKRLRGIAEQVLDILQGKTLQQVLDFIRKQINLDKILKVANETDFDRLDGLLKERVAAFLGKQKALMADLKEVQAAVKNVFTHVDKFYDMALQAAKKQHEFSFAARYARSTTKTALVDVSFDLSKAGALALLQKALDGDFGDLLLNEADGVTLNSAELTHNLKRNVSTELTMPFGVISDSAQTVSTAKLKIVEDNGRVLVYSLDATDEATQRKRLFGARSGRDSTLTVAATMPLAVGGTVKVWKESTFSYSYVMERAVARMRASQLQAEIGPLVQKYLPSAFSGAEARGFPEWVADLDKALDGKDPSSGTHDIGDTLVTLSLSAAPAYLRAWTKAPADMRDRVYMDLSRSLQASLKELVTFFYFAEPERYGDLSSAAAAVVYACLPVSTNIRLDNEGKVERFNLDGQIYWDQSDLKEIKAMVRSPQTARALDNRMSTIAAMLQGIPGLSRTAQFYDFDQLNYNRITEDALRRISATSPRPELLGSLLDLEQRLVENAVRTGVEMANFQQIAAEKPAEALKHLAEFGEDLASTFNRLLGGHPFMSGASRPLGSLLFLEAAKAFDRSLAGDSLAALMNITVIRSGKLSVEEMLDGKITEGVILHQQPFVHG